MTTMAGGCQELRIELLWNLREKETMLMYSCSSHWWVGPLLLVRSSGATNSETVSLSLSPLCRKLGDLLLALYMWLREWATLLERSVYVG